MTTILVCLNLVASLFLGNVSLDALRRTDTSSQELHATETLAPPFQGDHRGSGR